jgi:hypothetical protein
MKSVVSFLVLGMFVIGLLVQCGPSEEELRQQELARQDSLRKVELAAKEKARQDSIAAAEAARLEAERLEAERRYIEYDEDGPFTIQVEAWRSDSLAQVSADKWKKRGFENAYVVQSGDESTGDVWFRVRLARFENREWANKQGKLLREDYGISSWITRYQGDASDDQAAD